MRKNELKKWRENYTPWEKPCFAEGLRLNVHYEEKDFVKDIGGRWSPDPSGGKGGFWWMPVHLLSHKLGGDTMDLKFTPVYVNIFQQDDDDAMLTSDSGRGGNGLSVLDWLNLNKMIAGQHGGVVENEGLLEATLKSSSTRHACVLNGEEIGTFTVFEDLDVVAFHVKDNCAWLTIDNARKTWDSIYQSAGAVI